ncbi:hypothetical protein ACFL5L_06925 [candidate division KSB1 bacterium]
MKFLMLFQGILNNEANNLNEGIIDKIIPIVKETPWILVIFAILYFAYKTIKDINNSQTKAK